MICVVHITYFVLSTKMYCNVYVLNIFLFKCFVCLVLNVLYYTYKGSLAPPKRLQNSFQRLAQLTSIQFSQLT